MPDFTQPVPFSFVLETVGVLAVLIYVAILIVKKKRNKM